MIQSMTGYGSSTGTYEGKKINIELKSLNSRYFDLRMTTPEEYKKKEIDFRSILSEGLKRGKIMMNINIEHAEATGSIQLNTDLIKWYYSTLHSLSDELNIQEGDILNTIIRIPGVMQESMSELSDEEWSFTVKILNEAIENLSNYRMSEGKALSADMKSRIVRVLNELDKVQKYEEARLQYLRNKINNHLQKYLESHDIDDNRYEQELIYYIEKLDITEEKVRLKQHCSYFLDVLMAPGDTKGRKLNFISQEMGREINTLGAKANYSEIQHIVVKMKDELEKIKEQIANVV